MAEPPCRERFAEDGAPRRDLSMLGTTCGAPARLIGQAGAIRDERRFDGLPNGADGAASSRPALPDLHGTGSGGPRSVAAVSMLPARAEFGGCESDTAGYHVADDASKRQCGACGNLCRRAAALAVDAQPRHGGAVRLLRRLPRPSRCADGALGRPLPRRLPGLPVRLDLRHHAGPGLRRHPHVDSHGRRPPPRRPASAGGSVHPPPALLRPAPGLSSTRPAEAAGAAFGRPCVSA